MIFDMTKRTGGSGEYTADEIATRSYSGAVVIPTATRIVVNAFQNSDITSVFAPNVLTFDGSYVFGGCQRLSSIDFPKLNSLSSAYGFQNCTSLTKAKFLALSNSAISGWCFHGCTALRSVVLYPGGGMNTQAFYGCIALESVDMGPGSVNAGGIQTFLNCANLNTIVLRKSNGIVPLTNINAFDGTPFASNSTGGIIYIPKTLYDHLGDGTSLDYKVATNWAIIDGYGTITWAKIEGSQYENYFVDGTPIPAE